MPEVAWYWVLLLGLIVAVLYGVRRQWNACWACAYDGGSQYEDL